MKNKNRSRQTEARSILKQTCFDVTSPPLNHMFLYVFGWPHAPLLRQHVLYGCPNRGPTFSNLIFLKYEVYYWICKEPALYENHLEVIRGLSNQEVSQRVSIKKTPIATYFLHFYFWEKKQIFFILMPKAWFKVEKFRLL